MESFFKPLTDDQKRKMIRLDIGSKMVNAAICAHKELVNWRLNHLTESVMKGRTDHMEHEIDVFKCEFESLCELLRIARAVRYRGAEIYVSEGKDKNQTLLDGSDKSSET